MAKDAAEEEIWETVGGVPRIVEPRVREMEFGGMRPRVSWAWRSSLSFGGVARWTGTVLVCVSTGRWVRGTGDGDTLR